jgi:large subunit ribosomal protein L18
MTDLAKRSKRKTWRRERAHLRVRQTLAGTAERPRLSVYKSLRYVYAQLIDDGKGITLASVSSLEPALKSQLGAGTGNVAAAKLVGATLAERAKQAGIEKVVFDRGGYV